MSDKILNLDKVAAERAQAMVAGAKQMQSVKKPIDTLERLATKTLGVLQEQGVYACMLFLFSRTRDLAGERGGSTQGVYACMLFLFSRSSDEAKVAPVIRAQLFQAIQALPAFAGDPVPANDADAQTALRFYSDHVLGDLDLTLLVRDLYEQTLIYARYGAKAAGG
jgi:hypothetical protein